MTQFKITYGVGGGYNDCHEEVIEESNVDEAHQIAYEKSVELFNMYGIYEENDMTDEYDESEYQDSIERWVVHSAEPV